MSDTCTVQVALRIRPLVASEVARGSSICLDCIPNEPQVVLRNIDRRFTYNYVFGPDISQQTFYDTAVKDMVVHLFKGYNVTVLAYGQTGSGKTYSMGTSYSGNDELGVIQMAINDIFSEIEKKKAEDWEFSITVSFMELYQEQVYDLLAPTKPVVDIREDRKGNVNVPGLSEISASSPKEILQFLVQASSCRATGATAMNSNSSRSHAIFTINLKQQKKGDLDSATSAKFHLVDLAGSERSKKTKATGERFREGVNINRGLLALGNVISALGDENQSFISYRESKLTRLLQDSLGGNSVTLMIACVSPADYNLEETLSTLRYADRARKIKNKPIVNQDVRSMELNRLKQEVQELKLELMSRNTAASCPKEHQNLLEEMEVVLKKNRLLHSALDEAYHEQTNLIERALLAETARDRFKIKLSELEAEYGMMIDDLDQTLDPNTCPASFYGKLQTLKDLKLKIKELQAEQKRGSQEILNHELSTGTSQAPVANTGPGDFMSPDKGELEEMDQHHEAHTMEQVKLNRELQELNKALALKEELATQLVANATEISVFQPDYEKNMKLLEQQIADLQKEKDDLMQALKSAQQSSANNKISEQRRKKLLELEQKIAALQKKVTEQSRVIKMKDKSDEKIKQLFTEIQSMKQNKVKLVRQMRMENERFRAWKQQREREVLKLRDQDRKRQNQMAQMELRHIKQQNVMKRKMEEAVAINKRLKDVLSMQKVVQERRAQAAQGNSAKIQTWVTHELDYAVSTLAAEHTLDQLIEDRALLTQQVNSLKDALADSSEDASPSEIQQEIEQLSKDIEMRSAQIADIQQKIIESDTESKAKGRWDTIQSMIDAKFALKFLFDLAVDIKRDAASKERIMEDLKEEVKKLSSQISHYEMQISNKEQHFQEEILKLERDHQDRVYVLLKQMRAVPESGSEEVMLLKERIQFQAQELEKMEDLRRQLEKCWEDLDLLKNRKRKHNKRKLISTPEVDLNFTRSSEEEIEDDDNIGDPDWVKTPFYKKIMSLKASRATSQGIKRSSDGSPMCKCKTNCTRRSCTCRKLNSECSTSCGCSENVCQNRPLPENDDNGIESSPDTSMEDNFIKRPKFSR